MTDKRNPIETAREAARAKAWQLMIGMGVTAASDAADLAERAFNAGFAALEDNGAVIVSRDLLQALKQCEAMASQGDLPPDWAWVRSIIQKAEQTR